MSIDDKDREAIELLLDRIEWEPTGLSKEDVSENGYPVVTHQGTITLGNITIAVARLSDGTRIIPEEELNKLFKL